MHIPYVIDNVNITLAEVLNTLLMRQKGQQMDVATAYFSIRGYQQLRHNLPSLSRFRLLLGSDPQSADEIGLRPDARAYLRNELNAEPFTLDALLLVEEMVRFFRRDDVEVRLYLGHDPHEEARRRFLHAKCYLLYGATNGDSMDLWEHLNPLIGVVGSSNFTGPGLTTNRELNMVHKTLLDEHDVDDPDARREVAFTAPDTLNPTISMDDQRLLKSEVGARAIIDLANWYDDQWQQSTDFKDDLIDLLENSKFGGREYTPYEIYMKALYEYFKDDLDADFDQYGTRSAVELAEFQEDAVKKARRILARYDGVMIGDSVGLGKTWIGKKLLEEHAYHLRQKALVICPASLRDMWREELHAASISAYILSQEQLGQPDFTPRGYEDVDIILVDEAHNFRNHRTSRYQNLERIIAANGRRGRDGGRKKVILLTATPINNNIFDLYNQINLFAGNDPTYFASAGIGDLYRYFLAARRASAEEGTIRIFNLLEEVVIRRTRQFIRRAYPEATIKGQVITWPERQLRRVEYDLEGTYEGIYQDIVKRIEGLNLAHYNLESYKKTGEVRDDFELGRQVALVGIFKSRFLKRLESSIEAFRISIRRALEFVHTFAEYVQDDIILDSASFQNAMRLLEGDEEDEEAPYSRASQIDENEAARAIIDSLPRLDPAKYDRRTLYRALQEDINAFQAIWDAIQSIGIAEDAKLQRLKDLLSNELYGQKVLLFTYYKDTARYVYEALCSEENAEWRASIEQPHIRRIDSSVKSSNRPRIVEAFAPMASDAPDLSGTEHEIDILVATDVMSEGQNLQDCGHLINYDLHWNPTRMVQRSGRIDRLGSPFDVLTIYNLFPEYELERLLGLVKSLTSKIDTINQAGFLDASVLGEVVTPRDFNTLRRIADEDNQVIEEIESFLELASSEALFAQLQSVLATQAHEWLTDLNDGIHSGLRREQARGMFFYFKAPHPEGEGYQHFWRYYDLERRQVIDNRYHIMQLISCGPETPRYPPPYQEIDVFEIQEYVIEDILSAFQQQEAASLTAKSVSSEQTTISEILRGFINHPDYERSELRELRKGLKEPLVGAHVTELREALKIYSVDEDISILVEAVRSVFEQTGDVETDTPSTRSQAPIQRSELYLICYEYIFG